jgi:lipopolysaccharide transport system permease protein
MHRNSTGFGLKAFPLLARYRRLILNSVVSEIKQKHAGSLLGAWWLVLSPLLLLGVYVTVYVGIFRLKPAGLTTTQYVLYIFAGLIPFFGISEGLSAGTGSLVAHKSILKSTVFPAEIIAVRAVLASQTTFIFGLMSVCAGAAYFLQVNLTIAIIPVIICLQIMFVVGLTWILSLANILIRDVQTMIGYVLMMLMMLSPIAFTPAMIPDRVKPLIWLNPVSYYVHAYQEVLVFGRLPEADKLMVLGAISIVCFAAGFTFFVRAKAIVTDYA